jgi:MATE family multidrug resistance protein
MSPRAAAAAPDGWSGEAIREDLRRLLRLAAPVVTSRLAIMTMGLTDAIVVGRYSAEQLGFHALGWAPTVVVLMVAIGLLSGVQVMTARVIGEGRRHLAGAVLRRGLTYALWIGLASTAVLVAAGPAFLHAIGLEPGLANGASAALLVFALGMTFHTVSVAQTFWLEALNKAAPVMWMMWLANLANLALNLLLVPGTFGLEPMGAVGGAWSTLGARAALTVGLTIYIVRMPDIRALGVFDKPARDPEMEIEQRRVGYGAAFSNFSEVAAFAGMNVVAGWIGALEVAAYAIVLNVAAVIFMVPLGLATATSVLVGNAYGARDRVGVRRAGAVSFAVIGTFALVIALLLWPFAEPISRIYTDDPRAVALTVPALIIACFFLVPDALQVVVAHALRARGDVLMPSMTHMISYLAIMIPLSWWLAIPMGLGLNGIVLGIVAASFVSGGLLLWRWWVLARRP